jgi:hypothetical protein
MLADISKVLVLDNNKDDLFRISDALNSIGLATLPILYSIADPPEVPLTGIRLAFFDIKLFDGAGNEAQIINSLIQAIKQYISVENGPYVLIFWTSNQVLIKGIKEFVEAREKNNIPKPILVECIDKNFGTGDTAELKEILQKILSDDTVQFLLDYESKVSQAAGKTLNSLFKIVSNGADKWGENMIFNQNINPVLSTIAKEAVGYQKAREDQRFALKKSLEPILFDEIQKIDLSEQSGNLLSDLNAKKKNDIVFPEEFNHSLLNNVFHIEGLEERSDKTARGNIIKLILDERRFNEKFGFSKNGLLKKFFLNIDENTEAEFVLIEVSASCDFIQNKERLFKYILGIKSHIVEKKEYRYNSDSLFFMPTFFDESVYRLVFNFHFPLSLPRNSELLGEPLIRIKSDLLNHLSVNYSQYISRSGIIHFKYAAE